MKLQLPTVMVVVFLSLATSSLARMDPFYDQSYPFPPTKWWNKATLSSICNRKETAILCKDSTTYLSGQSCAQDASTGFREDVDPNSCPVTKVFLTPRKYATIVANLVEMVEVGAIYPRLANALLISPCGVTLSSWARLVYDNKDSTVRLFNQVDCEWELIDLQQEAITSNFESQVENPNGDRFARNIYTGGTFDVPNTFRVDPLIPGTGQFAQVLRKPMWVPVRDNSPHNATFKMLNLLVSNFTEWCTFLPQPSGDTDNGLLFIKNFNQFSVGVPTGNSLVRGLYCKDQCQKTMATLSTTATAFVQNGANYPSSKLPGSCPGSNPSVLNRLPSNTNIGGKRKTSKALDINFMQHLLAQKNYDRGAFLDSAASVWAIPLWVNNPRTEVYIFYPPGCDPNGVPSTLRRQWPPGVGNYWINQNLNCNSPSKYGSLDEVTGEGGWTSWNDFFSRHIRLDKATRTIPSRPVTLPRGSGPSNGDTQAIPGNGPTSRRQTNNYEISAPTDCIMNPMYEFISDSPDNNYPGRQYGGVRRVASNFLSAGTVIDVKGYPISAMALLGNAPTAIKKKFELGTGVVCILMPNTYHNYHSPVDGVVEYSEIMKLGDVVRDSTTPGKNEVKGVYGNYDFPNFDPNRVGNVGGAATDHSQWNDFQRSVVIINVSYTGACSADGKTCRTRTGHVASISVGLDTVGSVTLDPAIRRGLPMKRAYTRIGGFYYGGSMNVILFSTSYEKNRKGEYPPIASPAIKVRMGNSIAQFSDDEVSYDQENPFFGPDGVDPVYGTPYKGHLNPVKPKHSQYHYQQNNNYRHQSAPKHHAPGH